MCWLAAEEDSEISQFAEALQAVFLLLLFFSSQGSKVGLSAKPPCRSGFSQNFYTVLVPKVVLHGQNILKGTSAAAAAAAAGSQ